MRVLSLLLVVFTVSCTDIDLGVLTGASPAIPSNSWIKQIGAQSVGPIIGDVSGTDVCYGITTDVYGNSYCTGLSNAAFSENHSGSYDAVVVKLDPAGNIVWSKQIGADTVGFPSGDNTGFEYSLSVDVDIFGNVYFGGSTESSLAENHSGERDVYIAKLDPSGNFLWAKQLGADTALPSGSNPTLRDVCWDIAVNAIGDIYCGGYTYSSLGEANGGGSDAFVSKFDSNGNLQWITQLGAVTVVPGGGNGADYCVDIALDAAGNIYCGGSTTGSVGEANGGGVDILLMKLDPSGAIQWIRQVGAATTVPGGNVSGDEFCQEITLDALGAIYCSGGTGSSFGEGNAGGLDAFVAKFNASNGNLIWVKQLGTTTATPGGDASGGDNCYGVEVDNKGNAYCAGVTQGALGEANGGNDDIFVMKLSTSDGSIQWIRQLGAVSVPQGGDTSDFEFCYDIAVDPVGNPICAGRTRGNLSETIGGTSDIVVLKLSPDGSF